MTLTLEELDKAIESAGNSKDLYILISPENAFELRKKIRELSSKRRNRYLKRRRMGYGKERPKVVFENGSIIGERIK